VINTNLIMQAMQSAHHIQKKNLKPKATFPITGWVELCYGRGHCTRFPLNPLLFRPGMLPFVTTETFIWWSWMATLLYREMQVAEKLSATETESRTQLTVDIE